MAMQQYKTRIRSWAHIIDIGVFFMVEDTGDGTALFEKQQDFPDRPQNFIKPPIRYSLSEMRPHQIDRID